MCDGWRSDFVGRMGEILEKAFFLLNFFGGGAVVENVWCGVDCITGEKCNGCYISFRLSSGLGVSYRTFFFR